MNAIILLEQTMKTTLLLPLTSTSSVTRTKPIQTAYVTIFFLFSCCHICNGHLAIFFFDSSLYKYDLCVRPSFKPLVLILPLLWLLLMLLWKPNVVVYFDRKDETTTTTTTTAAPITMWASDSNWCECIYLVKPFIFQQLFSFLTFVSDRIVSYRSCSCVLTPLRFTVPISRALSLFLSVFDFRRLLISHPAMKTDD